MFFRTIFFIFVRSLPYLCFVVVVKSFRKKNKQFKTVLITSIILLLTMRFNGKNFRKDVTRNLMEKISQKMKRCDKKFNGKNFNS